MVDAFSERSRMQPPAQQRRRQNVGILFHLIAGTIFALVALLQALRIYMGWPVVIGGWSAPMWVSWIAIVVAGSLSYFALTLKSNR